MNEFQELEQRLSEEVDAAQAMYPCMLCHQTLVWAGGGFDTCENCQPRSKGLPSIREDYSMDDIGRA